MNVRRIIYRLVLGGAVCGLCLQSPAQTNEPDPFADISASGLLYEASQSLAAENYAAAIPYLTAYLKRMEPIKEPRVEALKQSVRFKLGKIYAYIEDPFTAADYLKQYTQTLPCYQPREAWKLLALTYYDSGQFEPCVTAATNALGRPLPKGLPGQDQKPAYEELSKKEMAGFSARQMKRIQAEAADADQAPISTAISEEAPEAEPDYTIEELVFIHMTLAEAYSKLENWEASIEPYQYVIKNAVNEDRKGYAIMQLVNSLVSLKRFDDAKDFIIALYNTNARYDIRVNMALMSTAAVLYQEAEYDSALMLYRMVLPRKNLVDFQVAKMDALRREAGLPRVQIQRTTNDMGRVQTVFGNKPSGSQNTDTFAAGLPPKPMALIKLEEATGVLLNLPPYEEDVLYRKGLLYARVGRPWEAVAALDDINGLDPDSERGQDAFVESLQVFIDPLKKYELADQRGWQFLNTYKAGRGPRRVAYALTGSYQKQENWKKVKTLLPVIEQFAPSEDSIALQYECELYYMQAIADVVLMDYPSAQAGFEKVLTDYPDSRQQENATYWHAMTQLFLKNYEKALGEFDAYAAAWPEGSWLASASFHSGVCLFGLEKYDDARERFTRVIETWPEDAVYSDACAMRGDLLASDGQLDKAQRDYEEAIAKARQPRQATYAVFQMASMFELEERYDEILQTVNDYLDHYGQEADVAKAAYWVGKTKLAQGLTGEAVDAYLNTILQFGDDVRQDGVDMIISELLTLYRRLTDEERQGIQSSLQAALQETDSVTLQLRLRMLLAKMNGTADQLGRQLNADIKDLTLAPPPVLAVLADACLKMKDYSRAEEILNLFQSRYEDSEFMKSALKLRAFELFEKKWYDEALKIADEAQAIYGTDVAVVWAQLMKGRIRLQQGELDKARKLLRAVLTVSQWRGEAFGEATYYLGQVEEAAGNLRDAFAWYQRAYFQWKGVAGGTWAAEGYLASARCLEKLGRKVDMLNTYRAMLFDKYVNTLPQADVARAVLGDDVVRQINTQIEQNISTNITVKLSAEETP